VKEGRLFTAGVYMTGFSVVLVPESDFMGPL